jgi:hypothetical protein
VYRNANSALRAWLDSAVVSTWREFPGETKVVGNGTFPSSSASHLAREKSHFSLVVSK